MVNGGLSWAGKRRAVIFSILIGIIIILVALTYRTTFYKAPSCIDSVQNQNEVGIDCGGVCPYLCTTQVQEPVVRFVRPLADGVNRTDIVAYVDNPNQSAAVVGAKYTVQLYGVDGTLLNQKSGRIDLSPHSTVPVFIPNFYSGTKKVANAFLTFDRTSLKWFTSTTAPAALLPSDIQVTNNRTPHITATIANSTTLPMYDIRVIIVVLGTAGSSNNVIAASQTIIPSISAQGTVPVVFTWNVPFPEKPVREEIFPIVPIKGP